MKTDTGCCTSEESRGPKKQMRYCKGYLPVFLNKDLSVSMFVCEKYLKTQLSLNPSNEIFLVSWGENL